MVEPVSLNRARKARAKADAKAKAAANRAKFGRTGAEKAADKATALKAAARVEGHKRGE